MRIALVAADFWPNVGGVAAHVVELGKSLVAAGHEVHVVSRPLGNERAPQTWLFGMQVHRPDLPQLRPICHWALNLWLRRFIPAQRIDVLHVHGLRPLPATRRLPVPVVFTNHTSGFLQRLARGERARQRVARWLDHVACCLAPSEELAEGTLELHANPPVRYVPNGVDVVRFAPGPSTTRRELKIPDDAQVVLLARRLVEKNGVCVFAEAVAKFLRPNVRVLFAGDGAERGKVEQILRWTDAIPAATFLGNIPNSQMPDIYRAANISVLPSFLEATSITGLESMATGLPLVGTNVGGIPALIDEGRTGFLVPPGDSDALAAAIGRLLDRPELQESFGVAARERAVSEFSWTNIAARTVDCYRRVIRSTTSDTAAAVTTTNASQVVHPLRSAA